MDLCVRARTHTHLYALCEKMVLSIHATQGTLQSALARTLLPFLVMRVTRPQQRGA